MGRLILILSNGQTGTERGFSVNRNVETQNLKEETFVSLKVIYDHIRVVGGLANAKIDKALLCSHPVQEENTVRIWITRNTNSKLMYKSEKERQMDDETDAVKKKKL